jgi:hypothetical protein
MPTPSVRRVAALAAALLAAGTAAQERPSEEELFGPPAAPSAPPPATPRPPPRAPRGEGQGEGGAEPALRPTENPLAIGGVAYLRATSSWREATAPSDWTLRSPNLLDLYADVRPNDRVRAYALGRLFYEPTQGTTQLAAPAGAGDVSGGGVTPFGGLAASAGTNAVLDQLWVNFDVGRTVFVTAGKQHVKWGVGRFWNPTDYLHPVKRDPLAVYDTRTGVAMVKAHLPWEARGWNLYGVGLLEDAAGQGGIGTVGRTAGGGRAELVLGSAELGLDALLQRGNRSRFGVDVSAGFWDLDVYGEAALRSGADVARFVPDPSPASSNEFDRWQPAAAKGFTPQATVGARWSHKYSDEDSLTIGAEYFYNDAGYADAHAYAALLVAQLFPAYYGLPAGPYFNTFYLGRHYGAVFVNLPKPGTWNDWDFTLSALGNLSDQTFIARFDAAVVVNTYLRVEAYLAGHGGPKGGEFRLAFGEQAIEVPTGLPSPVDRTPVTIPAQHAPILDAGIALRVNL